MSISLTCVSWRVNNNLFELWKKHTFLLILKIENILISYHGFNDNDCPSGRWPTTCSKYAGRWTGLWFFQIVPIIIHYSFIFQSGRSILDYQNQAKMLFRKLGPQSPPRCTIETGPYLFQYVTFIAPISHVL